MDFKAYYSKKEYKEKNKNLEKKDLECIIKIRENAINAEKCLSNSFSANYEKGLKAIIPKSCTILEEINGLLFERGLLIKKEPKAKEAGLGSDAIFQIGSINYKTIHLEIYSSKYSIYNYKTGIVSLGRKAKAPSIFEELFHAMQYSYNSLINNDSAEEEAFNARRILFPEDEKIKEEIMPEVKNFRRMTLYEIKKV